MTAHNRGLKTARMRPKIQISAQEDVLTFGLSRRIKAEEVTELQRLFEVEGLGRPIVLDLEEVKLVDRNAVRFLARCEANRIRLENSPAYIREWIVRDPA